MWHVTGETLLQEAVKMSSNVGLVQPNDHIVVVQMIHEAFVVKVTPFAFSCGDAVGKLSYAMCR